MPTTESALPEPGAPALWSRPTVAWMLYDLANTMFSFAILTFYFPRWLITEAGGNDALLGYAVALSMGVMLLSAPVLGALSDQTPRRMPFLVLTTLGCVGATALLGRGGLWGTLALFCIANYFFQAGLIFYDALLPEVSSKANRGRVSGVGVGVGYIGSILMLGAGALLLGRGASRDDLFGVTALLFLLFALPCFFWVRERPRPNTRPFSWGTIRRAFGAVWQTTTRLRAFPGLRRFLVGRIFYTDVANTLIAYNAIYGEMELGFSEQELTVVGAVTIGAAIAGGLAWGLLLDRIGPKRTLHAVLVTWLITILLAVLIPVIGLPRELFYGVGVLGGFTLAGTWASDRLWMLRLSPPEYLGQFYGLYAMVGRFGQIIGPLLWGWIAITLGLGRPAALASLFVLVLIALLVLRPVPDAPTPG